MRRLKLVGATALSLILVAGAALAAGLYTNGLPVAGGTQYPTTIPLTGIETIPVDTNLTAGQNPASMAVTTLQLSGYARGLAGGGNALIGGDATSNLWQRATTGSSVTTTLTYGGPDRWFYWSGTNTAMTVSRTSTAADLPSGYQYAFKMARTSGQTGVVQMCMGQVVEGANAYQFQGQTAELSFNAYTGANFSAASSNMTAYIVTGTGSAESASTMAFALNAGGGGSSTWTGQANATAAVISLGAVSTAGRYGAVATIPATATEIAVVLCYTPVGTASTNDYVAFDGIQLLRNPALAAYVSSTVGYASTSIPLSSYSRRNMADETQAQQRYFQKIAESAAVTPIAPCAAIDTTHTNCYLTFPTTMRTVPTMTYTAGFASPTSTTQATLGACSALATAATVTSTAANVNGVLMTCTATTIPAAGVASFLYSNAGAGVINASAEF